MKRPLIAALTVLMLLTGCVGTRTPRLARCAGPYRYANIYGTVLPSLPIPRQPEAPPKAAAAPETPLEPSTGAAPPVPTPMPPAPSAVPSTPAPDKTSALPPYYPSC